MVDNEVLRKAFLHSLGESGIENVFLSLSKGKYDAIQRAHDSIHEFIYLIHFCLPSGGTTKWQRKSAYILYHYQAFYQAHRSYNEAMSGYYNTGYILLRSALELMIRGAFWECVAHKTFRDSAEVIKRASGMKVGNAKKTILDWFSDIIEQHPSIENELEERSAAVFDKTAPLLTNRMLRKLVPDAKTIVEQLADWKLFHPIADPMPTVYDGLYADLSSDVHVIPDKTDIGRRLLYETDFLETNIVVKELDRYVGTLHRLMDIGVVISLNVFQDWISKDDNVKGGLRGRIGRVEDLKLQHSLTRLMELV